MKEDFSRVKPGISSSDNGKNVNWTVKMSSSSKIIREMQSRFIIIKVIPK